MTAKIKIIALIGVIIALFFSYKLVSADTGTFGYTTAGSSFKLMTPDLAYTYVWVAPTGANYANSISAYVNKNLISGTIKLCIWQVSDNALVGCTASIAVTNNEWVSGTINKAISGGASYYLGAISGGSSALYYDTGDLYYSATSTNSFATPTSIGTLNYGDQKWSIYVTYSYNTIYQMQFKGNTQFKSNTQIK